MSEPNLNGGAIVAPSAHNNTSIEHTESTHPTHPLEVVSDVEVKLPVKTESVHVTAMPNPPTPVISVPDRPERPLKLNTAAGGGNTVAPTVQPSPSKAWVHFDDENTGKTPGDRNSAAVIATESVQVNLERSFSENLAPAPTINANSVVVDPKNLRNIELPITNPPETIRQGFGEYF